ncbi:citryl-CoA lyase [Noviherbaspirillum denitrificans]|uniref:Citryl-CoA lyase n=1 Tax=Noviherbaspirillum denitrificans TaxID=1968433 RepID=A0A254TJA4_9BURK|nr:citryl-CoA lyase [Noviherbaspirillum denitrificans]OWW22706.1 citryl-CoA lyase [Noviherbaspirillum denitrificans]
MSDQAQGPDLLLQNIGPIKSRMGTFYPGSRVIFRGRDLHADLKDMDWLELYVYGVTGRRFSQPQLRVMHAIWTYTSYPDVRLWNNRVAALAASARSTGTMGVAAALAISEASIYGGGILARAIDFFFRAAERVDAGDDLAECIREELETHRNIGGYGRPIINGDERIKPMMDLAKEAGLADGRYLKLAFDVEEVLLGGRWRMKMNYAAIVAALGADLGLSRQEFYLFMFPVFLAGMQPCYIEATERKEGTLYPSRCTDILYDGPPKRPWSPLG